MKFLITGPAGLVGSQIIKDLTNQNHIVYSCYNNSKSDLGIPEKLDLLESINIKKIIDETVPDVILHLAAMTNVDLCETQKDLTTKINVNVTETLARGAAKKDTFF